MKDKVRFVHVSDIHLGCNPYGIKDRLDDMAKVFKEPVKYILENKDDIDFMIIAGDLFDKKSLNADVINDVISIIKPLNDINMPIYVTNGNHDMETYYNNYSWLQFLNENNYINLLNPEKNDDGEIDLIKYDKTGSYIEKDNYIIYGLGYPGIMAEKYINTLSNKYIENKDNKIVISMLHTGVGHFVTEGMGGVRENEIEDLISKSDYIALGHIHEEYKNEEKKYYNPGSLENNFIPDKVHDKGFYDVTISNDKKVETKFIKVNNRKCINLSFDLSSSNDVNSAHDDIINKVDGALKTNNISFDDHALLLLKLKGELKSQGTNINLNELKKELEEKYGLLYVELQNKLVSKREGIDINSEFLSRDEIDKGAIKNLILENGFENEDVDTLLDITMKMKELAQDDDLDLSTDEGKQIKEALLKYVLSKENETEDKNNED